MIAYSSKCLPAEIADDFPEACLIFACVRVTEHVFIITVVADVAIFRQQKHVLDSYVDL